jgi:transposase
MKTTFIGIDVSSATLDITVKQEQSHNYQIKNDSKEIAKFFRGFNDEQTLVALENTGRYNWALYEVLATIKCRVYVFNPFHLKNSLGLVRGKTDKIDAKRICAYLEKNYADYPIWKPSSPLIKRLKILLSERESRIKNKRRSLSQLHSLKVVKDPDLDLPIKLQQEQIRQQDEQIKLLEKEIEKLIKSDEQLKTQSKLIRSVPGVGKVLAWLILAKTEGFTVITEAKKLACYAGVVPFEHQSGTSIRGKTRVSTYADKYLKTILHLGAMSAIRLDNDLRTYYLRKVAEGKNKMSVLNAVRNKMIQRIFAVIRNEKEYAKVLVVS